MKTLLLALLFCLPGAASAEELQTMIVRPGDTLWSISNTYLKDPTRWGEILKYNHLPSSDPTRALPGMELKVPVSLIKEQYRAAKLVYSLNEVLYRRTGVSDWQNVALKMDLFKNDTLRTRADARADVRFYTGEILNLYPNSIAILRPPGKKNTDVELLAGEMRGLRSRVVTASARITPKTKDTEFGARLKDDLTTLVQVYKGKADVEAQGKTVEVAAGFAAEVKMDMPPSQPVKLPAMPELEPTAQTALASSGGTHLKTEGGVVSLNMKKVKTGPEVAAALPKDRDLTKGIPEAGNVNDKDIDANEIVKMISVANPVQSYHLQVSRDQTFSTLALDKNYDAFASINLNDMLPAGNYYMRIALVDLLGFEGKFSAPRQIAVGKR
jgi:LysM repeat protein